MNKKNVVLCAGKTYFSNLIIVFKLMYHEQNNLMITSADYSFKFDVSSIENLVK